MFITAQTHTLQHEARRRHFTLEAIQEYASNIVGRTFGRGDKWNHNITDGSAALTRLKVHKHAN